MPLLMYDGITVANWPADTTEGLVYTDGRYANATAAKARFPSAQFQTISATGQVQADWIDCEPGCVWPPTTAVALYVQWKPAGCRGIYFMESDRAQVEAAAKQAGVTPQEFGADWTNVAHINPGETETQFASNAQFDTSAIPAPAPTPPAPTPAAPGDPVTSQEVQSITAAVQFMLREEFVPAGELYGRVGEAVTAVLAKYNLEQVAAEIAAIKAKLGA